MRELLEKSNVDKEKLKRFINKNTAEQISSMSEPCYSAPFKKEYFELLKIIGLEEKDFRNFINNFYIERESGDKILKDLGTNVVLFIIYYFLHIKDITSYITSMMYLSIKFYSSEFHKFFPSFCNPDLFKYTLDHINKTHLFYREKTISNALFYISNDIRRKYTKDIEKYDNPEKISKIVYEFRNRIKQSIRSFANLYYRFSEEGINITTSQQTEDEETVPEQVIERGQRAIDTVIKNIVIYKQIDKKALEDAKKITGVNTNIANLVTETLGNIKYNDKIRSIYELFIKDLKDIKQLCGNDFYSYVQSLMSIKRTSKPIYFKQQVSELLNMIIVDSGYFEKFEKLTSQTKFTISSFLAFYMSIYFRNLVC